MHEYYQKSSGKLKKTMRGFLSLVRLELERITKQPYETAFEEIWRIYEHDMLGAFPTSAATRQAAQKISRRPTCSSQWESISSALAAHWMRSAVL